VIASDVLGYFAGRILGGPKFWPRVSPKKTWSGTVAGWVGAAGVGLGSGPRGLGSAALVWVSPLVAFAGQMGDIAESAIKRRAGVKDSLEPDPGSRRADGPLRRAGLCAILAVLHAARAAAVPKGLNRCAACRSLASPARSANRRWT
jgi:phosphatidate cytidylyltransferase